MRDLILVILLLLLTWEIVSLYKINNVKIEETVLAEQVEATNEITPTETPTATPSPTPSPTPTPTEKPVLKTPLPTPTISVPPPRKSYTPGEVNDFVNRFAAQYGVSPDVLRHIGVCESGFNPLAYNSGYAGLFQFGSSTWKNIRILMGENADAELRYDAEEAVQTAAFALSQGKSGIWPNCTP